jgi:hypothetical protein
MFTRLVPMAVPAGMAGIPTSVRFHGNSLIEVLAEDEAIRTYFGEGDDYDDPTVRPTPGMYRRIPDFRSGLGTPCQKSR